MGYAKPIQVGYVNVDLEVLTPGRILLCCVGYAAFGGFCKHHARSLQTGHAPWDVVERVEYRYVECTSCFLMVD